MEAPDDARCARDSASKQPPHCPPWTFIPRWQEVLTDIVCAKYIYFPRSALLIFSPLNKRCHTENNKIMNAL